MSDGRRLRKTTYPGIYRRGEQGYIVRYRDSNGRTRKKTARTLAQAREAQANLRSDIARGEYRETTRIGFADYARAWITTYQGRTSRGVRPQTLLDYRASLEHPDHGAIAFFADQRLASITPPDVKAYVRLLADAGLRPRSIRNYLTPLKAALADAFEDGLIRTDPAARVRVAVPTATRDENDKPRALAPEEVRALIDATAPRHRLLVWLLATTGLRVGEATALRWSDLHFGHGPYLAVRRRWYRGTFAPPKTRYGVRDVPLPPALAQALWDQRKSAPSGTDLIFPGPEGDPLSQPTVYRAVQTAGRAIGIDGVGCHTLRHTCASLLFRQGLNAKQVQTWLGHHSAAFTLATYVHLLPGDMPDATFLNDIVGGQRGHAGATEPPEINRNPSADETTAFGF